jgi:hypothetical protein
MLDLHEEAVFLAAEMDRRGLGDTRTALQRWCPHEPTPKQKDFLRLDCLEALFGGQAGGGKSDALLMAALMHVDTPGYAALILRRTYSDLSLPGAIMDRSHEWLGGTDAHWNGTEKTWTFPSGARLTFGYLSTDKDKYRYQGSELDFVAFDELTQFPEASYRYLMSRLRRRRGSKIPPRSRNATNPGGIGHDWVHARFIGCESDGVREFIPSALSDNPHLDEESYRRSLAELDEITRMQLEQGIWVKDSQGLVYKFSADRNLVDSLPPYSWRYALGVDFGASQSKPTTAFAVLAFSQESPAVYLVEATKHAGMIVTDIAEHIRALNVRYRFDKMVGDQGALGKGYIEEIRRRHGLPLCPAQKQDKLGYIRLMNGDLESERMKVVDGLTSDWIDEASTATLDETGTKPDVHFDNHALDATLYGWREARHYLYREPEVRPETDVQERYRMEAIEYKKRARQKISERRRTDRAAGLFG